MAETSPTEQASRWLSDFGVALEESNIAAATALFGTECYWRDLVTFTWNITTLEGQNQIRAMLEAQLDIVRPGVWRIKGDATHAYGVTEAWFTFETAVARGVGLLRLKNGACWTLLTTMAELKGHEEKAGRTREQGFVHGAVKDRSYWIEDTTQRRNALGHDQQPYCLIVGGGQAGIGLGARLKRLGVPSLIIDRKKRPGDAWRDRYKSLCLHDPVWFDHLPYLPFPEHWPVFSPKDLMGDWLEAYTKIMELDYWTESACTGASYDAEKREWRVAVARGGGTVTLRPKHLVLATGNAGPPQIPQFPGTEAFQGVLQHSSEHPGPDAYRGKSCVVIGSNNSAHDIAAALWEHGADVTMVQRSPTMVVKSETLLELGITPLYSEDAIESGIDHHTADLILASWPYKVLAEQHKALTTEIAQRDSELYERLRKAGFLLDFGEDGTGLAFKFLRRFSGYYIDVGASELVADGRIGLKSGVTVERITERSVVLSDGTHLEADLIVCATGYLPMEHWVADHISQEVADRVGRCWGLGSDTARDPGPWEGELRNMWKPTRQDALWFHGGNLQMARHYSQYLSLQIKARLEGVPTPVYGVP